MKIIFILKKFSAHVTTFVNKIIKTKIIWQLPKKNKILLYDAFENNFLIEFLKPWNPSLFYARHEYIYFPVFFLCLFRFTNLRDAYLETFIRFVSPTLIITFTDNSEYFYKISKKNKKVKTIFVQNGWRSYYGDIFEKLNNIDIEKLIDFKVDHKICFGSINNNYYSKYLKGEGEINIGSIKNNYFPKNVDKDKNLIIYISQWSDSNYKILNHDIPKDTFFKPTDSFIINFLIEYCAENKKEFKILLRNSSNNNILTEKEKDYFKSLCSSSINFIETNNSFNSYDACDSAEVVIGAESTLLYESLARGNKTAIFSIRDDMLSRTSYNKILKIKSFTFGWPGHFKDLGFFWTNKASTIDFYKILSYLINVDIDEWKLNLNNFSFDKLMVFDPGNKIMKSFLKKELQINENFKKDNYIC